MFAFLYAGEKAEGSPRPIIPLLFKTPIVFSAMFPFLTLVET